MLSKALPVIALAGVVAAQLNSSADTGHVESDQREIQLDGEAYDTTSDVNRDNWKREVIEDGEYTTDQELT